MMGVRDIRHQSLTKVKGACTQFSQKSKTFELIDIRGIISKDNNFDRF
jgi:hypothetical protein